MLPEIHIAESKRGIFIKYLGDTSGFNFEYKNINTNRMFNKIADISNNCRCPIDGKQLSCIEALSAKAAKNRTLMLELDRKGILKLDKLISNKNIFEYLLLSENEGEITIGLFNSVLVQRELDNRQIELS